MTDSISNGGCCSGSVRPGTYGNAYDVAQITVDKCGRITRVTNVPISGGGGGSSQWTGAAGSPIYYVPYVGIGSSATPTANLQVTGNVYVSAELTATTLYGNLSYLENNSNYLNLLPDGSFTFPNNQIDVGSNSLTIKTQSPSGFTWDWNDGSGSLSDVNINSGGVNFDVATPSLSSRWYFNPDGSTVLPNNLYASNAVTVPNVHVTDTLDVLGSMTANAANATFFFDTFTIPYINTQYLNVSANTTLTGNLVVATANIATLNVGYLTVNSAVVYGASTLNVYGMSNLTNVVASGNVYIGPAPSTVKGTLHVERGDVFIGNSAVTGTVSDPTATSVYRLTFDNASRNTTSPNKIVLYSNSASGNVAGLSISTVAQPDVPSVFYLGGNHYFLTKSTSSLNGYQAMFISADGQLNFSGSSSRAHLDIANGNLPSSNVQVRIDSSNIALVTSGSGLVGFGTITPTASLHVVGNVYASNAVTTTNVFANTSALTGTTGQTTLNVTGNLYVSNAVTTTNIATAGFTSNATNTVFNFDTLTIPFINSTTLNVASTSNLQAATVTTLTVQSGGTLTVQSGGGINVGSGILGSNVVVFSNVSGGSNTFVMDSNGRITIGSTYRGGSLLSFGQTFANKILTLYDVNSADNTTTATNFYGFGIGTLLLRYQVPSTASHIFYGASSEYARITGTGVSILTGANPTSNLQVQGNVYVSNAVTTTNVFASTISATNPISFRNRIINGDFIVDQRNAGAATTPTIDGKSVIDRWKINIVGLGRCQVGQNLGAIASPTGFTSYFGMKVTTTSTVNAGDYFFVSQIIEGINAVDFAWGTASARTVTLGFWVYSSLTGTMGGFVRNAGATAGDYTRSYPFTFNVSSASTWEYKTVTIPGDTTGQWISGQVDGIEIGIVLWNGSTYQASPGAWAAGNFTGPSGGTANFPGTLNSIMYLTGVQVELGPIATAYERRHMNVELAMCQRYYEPSIARLGGYNLTGANLRSSVYFNTKKRPAASPTFTVISQLENTNMGSLTIDNSNFDQSSARILAPITATGDGYGQWKVSVDCEF